MDKISYFEHEAIMSRMERASRRIWITSVISLVLLVASNTIWIINWIR